MVAKAMDWRRRARAVVALTGMAMALWFARPGAALAQDAETDPAPSAAETREDQVGPKPDWSWLVVLRVVTETDYPPFNYYDEDGALTGFNVDLARAICAELNVTCEVNPQEWDGLVRAVQTEQADAIMASMAITPRTIEQVDFTEGYYATPAKFVTRAASALNDIRPEAMTGVKVGVVKDTAHERYLRDFFAKADIVTFDTDEALRSALKGGQVEALFGDAITVMFWINGQEAEGCCQFRGRGFLEARYFGEGVGIAVAKGNIRLKEVLNYALTRVRASGRFEELMLRYFPLAIY